jgi:hypothetical protein
LTGLFWQEMVTPVADLAWAGGHDRRPGAAGEPPAGLTLFFYRVSWRDLRNMCLLSTPTSPVSADSPPAPLSIVDGVPDASPGLNATGVAVMSRETQPLLAVVKLGASVAAATGTGLLMTEQLGITDFSDRTDIGLIIGVGALSVAATARSFWWEVRLGPRERLEQDVEDVARQTARAIAEIAGVPRACLGVSVHRVRRDVRGEYLHPLARVRDNADPAPSPNIRWTQGKGIIGRCWQEGGVVYEDLERFATKYKDCTQQQYERLSQKKQMYLRWAEFRAMIGKYSSVLAYPIVVDQRFLGCVAVDLPLDANFPGVLDRAPVRELTGAAARSVGKLLT